MIRNIFFFVVKFLKFYCFSDVNSSSGHVSHTLILRHFHCTWGTWVPQAKCHSCGHDEGAPITHSTRTPFQLAPNSLVNTKHSIAAGMIHECGMTK